MSEPAIGRSLHVFDLFRPVWAGPWTLTRYLWVFAAALALVPRAWGIGDAYGARDVVFTSRLYPLNDYLDVTTGEAWVAWVIGVLGLVAVAWGGRLMHVGLVAWFLGDWFLLMNEALNIKAYDEFMSLIALALFVSPAAQRGLAAKWRSPFARYVLILCYCSIYASTGFHKMLHEPRWLTDGSVLGYHLVHAQFAREWSVILSDQTWLLWPATVLTIVFQVGFVFVIWFKRINPWWLLLGASFHVALFATMSLGPFSFVALSGYPVLLAPEVAEKLWERARERVRAWRS